MSLDNSKVIYILQILIIEYLNIPLLRPIYIYFKYLKAAKKCHLKRS